MNNLSLKDFLKKYTAISEKFIDEYYKFYEICEKHLFGILADNVAIYLGIENIKKFVERIREKYKHGSDYIIIRKKKKDKSVKGVKQDKETYYFLTFDCFEKICMMSHAEKANDVRDYFIILRKFISYYREHFADKINDLVNKDGGVYILLTNKNKNIFKFGKADKNFRQRFKSYATGHDKHPDIKFIMHTSDPQAVEKCTKLFTTINQVRGKSELRKIDINILKEIMFSCALLDTKFNKIDLEEAKKYDAYIIFEDGDELEYINIRGDIVGYEKVIKTKSKSKKLNSMNHKSKSK